MRRHWSMRARMLLGLIPLLAAGTLLVAPAAVAAPLVPDLPNGADSVTLTMNNGTTFGYASSTTPQFAATVVLGAKPSANYSMTLYVNIDGAKTNFGASPQSQSNDGLTYTFVVNSSWSPIMAPGTHSAVGVFTNPSTGVTTQSSPVNFTVNKGTPSFQCMITNDSALVSSGYTLDFQMTPQSQSPDAPVDWQKATYTVKFVGPTTVTRSNLVPDSNDVVTAQAPTQYADYTKVDCTFNGTTLFAPANTNAAGQPVLVSQEQHLGGIQLYTNPTTLASNQPADLYVVLHAASGGPTPTGAVGFTIGRYYSANQNIGSDGTVLVHTTMPNLSGASEITISYTGDPYYNLDVVNFPLTNPPIAGGGGGSGGGNGGGGSGGSGSVATGTPSASATSSPGGIASVGGGSTGTPAAGTPDQGALASTHSAQGSGALWWIVLLVLMLAGGAGSAVFVLRRARASSRAAPGTAASMATMRVDAFPPTSPRWPEPTDPSERDTEWR